LKHGGIYETDLRCASFFCNCTSRDKRHNGACYHENNLERRHCAGAARMAKKCRNMANIESDLLESNAHPLLLYAATLLYFFLSRACGKRVTARHGDASSA